MCLNLKTFGSANFTFRLLLFFMIVFVNKSEREMLIIFKKK